MTVCHIEASQRNVKPGSAGRVLYRSCNRHWRSPCIQGVLHQDTVLREVRQSSSAPYPCPRCCCCAGSSLSQDVQYGEVSLVQRRAHQGRSRLPLAPCAACLGADRPNVQPRRICADRQGPLPSAACSPQAPGSPLPAPAKQRLMHTDPPKKAGCCLCKCSIRHHLRWHAHAHVSCGVWCAPLGVPSLCHALATRPHMQQAQPCR